MEELVNLFHGFAVALQPFNIMVMVVGIVLGVVIGVLPGLGGANGVAILLPLTFSMPPTSAIIMLSCIYWGALFGGAITSILFNIPGEPWSVATTFDGYPMAQKGKAGEALTAAFTSSFVGALFAVDHDHAGRAAGRKLRAAIRAGGEIRGLFSGVLQFRRIEQGAALQDHCGHDDRICAGRRRPRLHHRTVAADVRLYRIAERVRLPHRRHRPVRHRRDPADDGGRARLPRRQRQDQSAGGAADLEGVAGLLGDVAALLRDRLLDGHHAGRRDAGLLHELRHRQAGVEERQQFRQGRNRRRGRAGDRGARRRHRGVAADAFARRAGLADGGRAARRPPDLGPAARTDAVRRTEGIRLGPDRLDVSRQYRRPASSC